MLAFLDHLEAGRGNSARTRNARLTAIRAFVTYASARDPTSLPLVRPGHPAEAVRPAFTAAGRRTQSVLVSQRPAELVEDLLVRVPD